MNHIGKVNYMNVLAVAINTKRMLKTQRGINLSNRVNILLLLKKQNKRI